MNHKSNTPQVGRQGRLSWLLLFVGVAFLAASCVSILSTDTRVTLGADENWQTQFELVFEGQQAQAATGQIESSLNQFVSSFKTAGIDANWTRESQRGDGNVGYRLAASGHGLDSLNSAFFNNQRAFSVAVSSGQRQIVFRYNIAISPLGLTGQQSFTLVGGQILSSNGTAIDAHTVTWINPSGTMEAELTEATNFGWLPYVLIGGGLVLSIVAGMGWLATHRRNARRSVITPSQMPGLAAQPAQAQFCVVCGRALLAEADFCPNCGTKR